MASLRHQRRKACGTKVRYETVGAALDARRRRPFGRELGAYHCRFCGGFHLGHPPKHVRQAIAARREGKE